MKYCCDKFKEEFEYTIHEEHEYHEGYDEGWFYIDASVDGNFVERLVMSHCLFCGKKL